MRTPSDQLVDLVFPKLISSGLLLPEDAEKYRAKIATGSIKSEDWLLSAEKAIEKEDDL